MERSDPRGAPGGAVLLACAWFAAAVYLSPGSTWGQQPSPTNTPPPSSAESPQPPGDEAEPAHEAERPSETEPAEGTTITTDLDAGESDAEEPRRQWTKFNEFDGPISTFRWGFGFLADFASYEQDEDSEAHFDMPDDSGLRDFRLMIRGEFKTKRPITWTLGYMYDGSDEDWHFRQTGIQIGIPEAKSRVFIGRTKEGYSLIKIMTGYYGWTNERSPALDAFVPILGDGVKWMFYAPKRRTFFSLGYFFDENAEREKFATYDDIVVGRVGVQPLLSEEEKEVLHVAVMARSGRPDEGVLQPRSKPGAFLSPYFLDVGPLQSDRATTAGYETYYRKGSWLFGTEYNWQEVEVATGERPVFHAGDAVVTWNITGETRPYNATGAFFGMVSPERSVYEGGWGALEAVLHFSYSDFDEGSLLGGKFWRVTPMLNWYLSDHIRLEFTYGYGELDRFGVTGATQFFQFRTQLAL